MSIIFPFLDHSGFIGLFIVLKGGMCILKQTKIIPPSHLCLHILVWKKSTFLLKLLKSGSCNVTYIRVKNCLVSMLKSKCPSHMNLFGGRNLVFILHQYWKATGFVDWSLAYKKAKSKQTKANSTRTTHSEDVCLALGRGCLRGQVVVTARPALNKSWLRSAKY